MPAFYSVETKSVTTVVKFVVQSYVIVDFVSVTCTMHANLSQAFCVRITNEEFIKNKESKNGQIVKKKHWKWKYAFVFSRIYLVSIYGYL